MIHDQFWHTVTQVVTNANGAAIVALSWFLGGRLFMNYMEAKWKKERDA